MIFESNQLYHIYNRSINREPLFYKRENFLYFLTNVRKKLSGQCDFIAYCLMPNHFHFLVYTKENFDEKNFKYSIGVLLRSYAQAINKQEGRTGSLFQQHTKAKCLTACHEESHSMALSHAMSIEYAFICFNYIHQNPMKANLVQKMEDWEFSSFRDYVNLRNGSLCNKELAQNLLDIDLNEEIFYKNSYKVIHPEKTKAIF